MRLLKGYFKFIREAKETPFNLELFYKKYNIPEKIQDISAKFITEWTEDIKKDKKTGKLKMPFDVNIDKLKLWYARNLTNYLLKNERINNEALFSSEKETTDRLAKQGEENGYDDTEYSHEYGMVHDVDRKLLRQSNNLLNYLKCKPYNKEDFNETRLNSMIGNFKKETYVYMTHIKDYIFSNTRNADIWSINYMADLKELYDKSIDWHAKLKASGSITSEEGHKLIEYPDGFYWIDLQTNDCEEEADAMGHCGRTSGDTILSLRQIKKDGTIEPFVTIAIDYLEDFEWDDIDENFVPKYSKLYQCKGKNNKSPVEKYHKYIVDLYIKFDIGEDKGHEYQESCDFKISDVKDNELLMRIFNENPNLIKIDDIIFYENENLAKLLLAKFPEILLKMGCETLSNNYYLYEKGLITKEDMVNKYPKTLMIEDDILYMMSEGELKDLAFMYENKDSRDGTSRGVVENLDDTNWSGDSTTFKDLSMHYLTDRAEKAITDKIKELKKNMDKNDKEEFKEYTTWEDQIKNIDALSDLKQAIEWSFHDAQNDADEGDKYKEVLKPLKEFLDMDNLIYYSSGILFKINKDWLIRFDKFEGGDRKGNMTDDMIKDYFEEKEQVDEKIAGEDLLRINIPNYGWNGTIDKQVLEERLLERLDEVN
jgi:hypothetical protein